MPTGPAAGNHRRPGASGCGREGASRPSIAIPDVVARAGSRVPPLHEVLCSRVGNSPGDRSCGGRHAAGSRGPRRQRAG